jgi:CHAD domain-containing protein
VAKQKDIVNLDCGSPAAEAIEIVLRDRLEKMCALRDRALDWSDPEGVHDMRVASRRLRSALSDFKSYLRRERLPYRQLKMIAAALGTVRDEDVSLLALESLKSQAAERIAEGIEAIADERRRRRLQERAALEKVVGKSEIEEFQKQFVTRIATAFRISGQPNSAKTADKLPTFRRVGVEVITGRLKGLSEGSEGIYDPTRTKELHRLRILAKRLRYAVELFSPCWDDEFRKIAREVARMQTSLGGLHDCDMWIAELGPRIKKCNRAKGGRSHYDPRADAAVWLLQYFIRERTNHYGDALICWQEWQASGFLTKLKRIVRKN